MLHQLRHLGTLQVRRAVPKATTAIPDAAAFLNRIGRSAPEFVEAFPTWESLFTTNSPKMKELGVDPQSRKYILHQVERFRKGLDIAEVKKGVKKNGGERKAKLELGKKRVLAGIEMAQRQKALKKAERVEVRLGEKWDRLHEEAGSSL